MRVTILRSCVGDGGATLEAGATVDLSDNVARLLIGNLQAEIAGEPEPEPQPKKVAKKKVARKTDEVPEPSDESGD